MMNEPHSRQGTADSVALIQSRSDCPHVGGPCAPGRAICARLAMAIRLACPALDADFEVSGTVLVTACQRECLVAFRGTPRGTWCFGDVAPGSDLDRLVAGATGMSGRSGAVMVATPCVGPMQ